MKKRRLTKLKHKKHPRKAYFIDEIHVFLTFPTKSPSFIYKRNIVNIILKKTNLTKAVLLFILKLILNKKTDSNNESVFMWSHLFYPIIQSCGVLWSNTEFQRRF